MTNSDNITQNPAPGTHLLMFRGDTMTFSLFLSNDKEGEAWIRTNIGHAAIARRQVIKQVDHNLPLLGRDWFDIPMNQVEPNLFKITLPLCDVGHFEAKCFFLKKGEAQPIWPGGSNTVINVEPADTCCGNIIYNAFVRQFGPNKKGDNRPTPSEESLIEELDQKGYEVIPPSGTFRGLIAELDFIIGKLGCRIIQLLPVHPTPTTYARMGRFGSPYAALSFIAVEPALAVFDPAATPLEQFIELVDAVHARNARIIIDIAINHTGWAANLHGTHPQWLVRDKDGRIEMPGAWGIIWGDLTRLDYTHKDLWKYMVDVYLTWCRRGVDGFRCDAGYMIPIEAWKYIVTAVREQFPDTIFFLEGLGGSVSVTRDILNKANFNWAYSELFQNYDRNQIENYLPEAIDISNGEGITVHFAETHDNERLAARSKVYSRMRTALCALCSHEGGFGFANGVEWFADEKINVHDSPSLNWGSKINQVDHIQRLCNLLKNHPAFFDRTRLKLIQKGTGNSIVLLRRHIPSGKRLLVVANLDDINQSIGSWDPLQADCESTDFVDLMTDKTITVTRKDGKHTYLLGPGQVLCLSPDMEDINLVSDKSSQAFSIPGRSENQQYRAKVLDVFRFYHGIRDIEKFDLKHAAESLSRSPKEFCRGINPYSEETRVVTWQWPRDKKREVVIPPEHFIMVCADSLFCAQIIDTASDKTCVMAHEKSMACIDGSFFVLFSPLPVPGNHCSYMLKLTVYGRQCCEHVETPLLFLSQAKAAMVKRVFMRSEILSSSLCMLGTNQRGGMLRAHASWGTLNSKYDALLAANLNPDFPEDRWIMFARCRAWVVYQGYSQEISSDCFESFSFDYNSRGFWQYHIPTGQGEDVVIQISIEMVDNENAVRITFSRQSDCENSDRLSDAKKIRLILRPDIEDRNFHESTKAFKGPEHTWESAVTSFKDSFTFAQDVRRELYVRISQGEFVWEPEWHYAVHRFEDAQRGLDPDSDLFSPGYFATYMEGGQTVELLARVSEDSGDTKTQQPFLYNKTVNDKGLLKHKDVKGWELSDALKQAMDSYVVKRGVLKTVIAGYPWFLDWGRDALIFCRGLITAGRFEDAREILKQFGRFEKDGTLPNMIHGNDARNRDTSDAPLWFFVACKDFVCAKGDDAFLDEVCGSQTIRKILTSMGRSLLEGMPNGIKFDAESGLLYSPAHFTWMDTNHPACTPRQGYPIEIQALWYAALSFLSCVDSSESSNWEKIAQQVKKSILELFWLEEEGFLADCLHADEGISAKEAEIDDALRPNQLFAITLGAVTNNDVCRKIVAACEELLVPGAIRSLSDRPVRYPIEVVYKDNVINDPYHPYQGRYIGDEDTRRKPAYHNGTAWTWPFPAYCEAWFMAYGEKGKAAALALLGSSTQFINQGCAGHVPEIVDGDYPHAPRGCDAQAWGVSELLRVWELLK